MSAPEADLALLDDLAVALREERRRAPSDLLAVLTVLIVTASVTLLLMGVAVGPGVWQDVLLNLTAEGIGVAITVAVIGGVWQRFQAGSYETFDDLVRMVDARRSTGLTAEERDAFRLIVELHHSTRDSNPLVGWIRGIVFAVRHRRRLSVLEAMLHGDAAPR